MFQEELIELILKYKNTPLLIKEVVILENGQYIETIRHLTKDDVVYVKDLSLLEENVVSGFESGIVLGNLSIE